MLLRDQILTRKAPVSKAFLSDGTVVYSKKLPYRVVKELIERQKTATGEWANMEIAIDWIILAAVDENGEQAFTEADRAELCEQDADFLGEFAKALISGNNPKREDAEKNS